jgi:excisionase family DNA binding protein
MKHNSTTPKAASGEKNEILTAEEVSLRLRLPLSTVYYLAKTGALPGFQLGRSWRFSSSELDRLAQPKPAQPPIPITETEMERQRGGKNDPAKSDAAGNKNQQIESFQSPESVADTVGRVGP